jgi:hypothetical protein
MSFSCPVMAIRCYVLSVQGLNILYRIVSIDLGNA